MKNILNEIRNQPSYAMRGLPMIEDGADLSVRSSSVKELAAHLIPTKVVE
jgi:hypothetical protein